MLRHLPFLIALVAGSGLASGAGAHQIKIESQPDGASLAAPTFKLQEGRQAAVLGVDRLQPLGGRKRMPWSTCPPE
ncbi:hypothetical protein LJR219_004142 [Phenylobacterium sp. LjRoot219]|uniref:hypothetical protein n=1 Tax=Phenylobacterium sp. LjRoot219 TaxID=3342283 RepID=UPI003ECCEED8